MSDIDEQYSIILLSKSENIKWPRYEVHLNPGLNFKQATDCTYKALRTNDNQTLMLSQFKYDSVTGVVDTRVNRTHHTG